MELQNVIDLYIRVSVDNNSMNWFLFLYIIWGLKSNMNCKTYGYYQNNWKGPLSIRMLGRVSINQNIWNGCVQRGVNGYGGRRIVEGYKRVWQGRGGVEGYGRAERDDLRGERGT